MSRRFAVAILCALASATPGAAPAQLYAWSSSVDGAWNDPVRWSPQGIPNSVNETVQLNCFG
jgi:hypothetical protein